MKSLSLPYAILVLMVSPITSISGAEIANPGDTTQAGARTLAATGAPGGLLADCEIVDPFPSTLIDTSGLSARHGSIRFRARDGNTITAFTYRATGFVGSGPILFVMHGSGRTAESYLEAFKPIAERHSALAVAPRFDKTDYPKSADYTLGIGVSGTPSGGVHKPSAWRAPQDYLYSEIEHLFEALKTKLGSHQCSYRIFGHSAGAQFTQRLLTFRSDARVFRAAAANSGWYTLPADGGGSNSKYFVPYGLQGSPVTTDDVEEAFGRELVVLLGTEDTATAAEDSDVRGTAQANFQGSNRLERGQFYFARASSRANARASKFAWLADTVLGAGHDKDEMAASAGWYLFREAGELPCTPNKASEAGGLVFNEILADPAADLAGDANNDGLRDANGDEFLELVNTGATNLCLTGWTLGDAAKPERHRFPIGSRIAPGQALVIFGGGVPTGDFGGAIVQWAAFGGMINMNNSGDVLTLADRRGTVHSQISWGDCAGVTCAAEHITRSLGIDQAMVRKPELTGAWARHTDLAAGVSFSPGRRAGGTAFMGELSPPTHLRLEIRKLVGSRPN